MCVMCHGDDQGLVLPPRVAPLQAVIIPIVTKKVSGTGGCLVHMYHNLQSTVRISHKSPSPPAAVAGRRAGVGGRPVICRVCWGFLSFPLPHHLDLTLPGRRPKTND